MRLCAVVLGTLLLAGCGAGARLGPRQTSVPDTREFGFIVGVDAAARTIEFDPAEWLTGAEASRAAEAAGAVEPGEAVPNDYFIRNPDKETKVLKLTSETRVRGSAPVTHLKMRSPCEPSGRCRQFPVSLDEFFAAWAGEGRGADGKYWVTSHGAVATAIEEQYTP